MCGNDPQAGRGLSSTVLSAAERIRRHAELGQPADETAPTVSAASDGGSPAEVEAATADLVDALDSFTPNSTAGYARRCRLASPTLFLVVSLTQWLRLPGMLRNSGADHSAWAVETAWHAVLAGDVGDVREHVTLEEAARRE